jgi:hypothetical protein
VPTKAAIVAGLILVASTAAAAEVGSGIGNTYYVSSSSGDDTSSGTTADAPWKTLARVEAAGLGAGDRVLFRGGERFAGTLTLSKVLGTADARVVLSSYGEGRAKIDGGVGSGLVLESCEYLTVKELSFVGSGRKRGNDGYGVRIARGANNEVDSVDASGFRLAGISTGGDENTRITNVRAHHNGFAGISVQGATGDLPFTRNLYIGHSVADNNPGDPKNSTNHSGNGIVVGGVKGGLIEYSEAFNNGWDMPRQGNGPVGIWGYFCDRLVIQHCIAHHNKTSKGAHDGGGFDLDGGATNSVLQYNLSYANHGTGYLLCQYPGAAPWKNNICRYNISIDDGRTGHFSGIYFWAGGEGISDALIHNNLIINARHAVASTHDIPGLVFRNNIFVSDDAVVFGPLHDARFEGNLYMPRQDAPLVAHPDRVYNSLEEWAEATARETVDGRLVGRVADPRIVLPLDLRDLPTDPEALREMMFYKLIADSPAVGIALPIEGNGGQDLWHNPVAPDGPRNVGPFEGAREPPIMPDHDR